VPERACERLSKRGAQISTLIPVWNGVRLSHALNVVNVLKGKAVFNKHARTNARAKEQWSLFQEKKDTGNAAI